MQRKFRKYPSNRASTGIRASTDGSFSQLVAKFYLGHSQKLLHITYRSGDTSAWKAREKLLSAAYDIIETAGYSRYDVRIDLTEYDYSLRQLRQDGEKTMEVYTLPLGTVYKQ